MQGGSFDQTEGESNVLNTELSAVLPWSPFEPYLSAEPVAVARAAGYIDPIGSWDNEEEAMKDFRDECVKGTCTRHHCSDCEELDTYEPMSESEEEDYMEGEAVLYDSE